MKLSHRIAGIALAVTMSASAFVLPIAAQASEEGKRNTTYALGAAAAALLLTQKNKIPGIVAAAGAGYAYTKYNDDVKARHRREREYGYDDNYYRNDRYNNDRYNNDRYNRDNYDTNYRNRNDRYNTNSGYDNYNYNSDDPDCRNNGNSSYRSNRNNRYDNSAEYYDSRAARVNSRRGR